MSDPAIIQLRSEPDPAKRLRLAWGHSIRRQRQLKEMTLDELAAAMTEAGSPVTAAAVGMWERGETAPRWHHQFAVARVLGVTHDVLFREVA